MSIRKSIAIKCETDLNFSLIVSYNVSYGPVHNDSQTNKKDLLLSFGSIKKGEFNIMRNVSLILRYPYNDLALLQLDIELNPVISRDGSFYVINYICLPNDKALNVNPEEAIIVGSGQNWIIPHNYTGPPNYNKLLRKAIIRIDSALGCWRHKFRIQYICAPVSVNMTCYVCFDSSFLPCLNMIIPTRAIPVRVYSSLVKTIEPF